MMDELAPRTFYTLERLEDEAEKKKKKQEEMEKDAEEAKQKV